MIPQAESAVWRLPNKRLTFIFSGLLSDFCQLSVSRLTEMNTYAILTSKTLGDYLPELSPLNLCHWYHSDFLFSLYLLPCWYSYALYLVILHLFSTTCFYVNITERLKNTVVSFLLLLIIVVFRSFSTFGPKATMKLLAITQTCCTVMINVLYTDCPES